MKYHEIGEVFEHDGVVLEAVKANAGCDTRCFFIKGQETRCYDFCNKIKRKDKEQVYFRLIEDFRGKQANTESKKNDRLDDKLRWELLPLEDVEDIVRVYTAGAKKYGSNKWQNLPDGLRRYKAALLRHLVEFDKGNEIDEETGCRHLAQVAWNAIAMLHISKQNKQ